MRLSGSKENRYSLCITGFPWNSYSRWPLWSFFASFWRSWGARMFCARSHRCLQLWRASVSNFFHNTTVDYPSLCHIHPFTIRNYFFLLTSGMSFAFRACILHSANMCVYLFVSGAIYDNEISHKILCIQEILLCLKMMLCATVSQIKSFSSSCYSSVIILRYTTWLLMDAARAALLFCFPIKSYTITTAMKLIDNLKLQRRSIFLSFPIHRCHRIQKITNQIKRQSLYPAYIFFNFIAFSIKTGKLKYQMNFWVSLKIEASAVSKINNQVWLLGLIRVALIFVNISVHFIRVRDNLIPDNFCSFY